MIGLMSAYLALPALGVLAGGTLGARQQLSLVWQSAVQHFAAGVVFAALATEIVPNILHGEAPGIAIVAFLLGVIGMFGMRMLTESFETRDAQSSPYPLTFIGPIAVDCVIDGIVVGAGFASGTRQGLLIAAALTLEMFFLGLATAAVMKSGGGKPTAIYGICAFLGFLLVSSAAAGLYFLAGSSPALLTAFLAFGSAALLYLVTEELLIRAHSVVETSAITSLFFLGFIIVFGFELYS
ncbi:MAG: ZIP family metal transporter [Allorhizobium sp.]